MRHHSLRKKPSPMETHMTDQAAGLPIVRREVISATINLFLLHPTPKPLYPYHYRKHLQCTLYYTYSHFFTPVQTQYAGIKTESIRISRYNVQPPIPYCTKLLLHARERKIRTSTHKPSWQFSSSKASKDPKYLHPSLLLAL